MFRLHRTEGYIYKTGIRIGGTKIQQIGGIDLRLSKPD